MKLLTGLCSTAAAFALAATAPLQAQNDRAQTAMASNTETTAEPDGPALWKVADEDTTIYLFGTVHALPEGVDWFSGPVADALTASDMLVTEIHVQPGSETSHAGKFPGGRNVASG